jgi:hypothetical protein
LTRIGRQKTLDEQNRIDKDEQSTDLRRKNSVNRFQRLKHHHFKDYVALKVGGHDEYSRKRLPDLERLVSDDVTPLFADMALEDQAKGNRWILRGLSPQQARRKIEVDMEVAANAIESIRRKRLDDYECWDED